MKYRAVISITIVPNTQTDSYLWRNMKAREPVSGATISNDKKIDPHASYQIASRTELDASRVMYTLEMVGPAGAKPVPPNAPATAPAATPEPTIADLMREIKVLQNMVAVIAQSAHGAALVVRG